MFCPKCGSRNDGSWAYCAKCGHKLARPTSHPGASGSNPAIPGQQRAAGSGPDPAIPGQQRAAGSGPDPAIPGRQRAAESGSGQAIPGSQQMEPASYQAQTQSAVAEIANPTKRKGKGFVIAVSACVLIVAVAISLLVFGVIPPSSSPQGSASAPVAANSSSGKGTNVSNAQTSESAGEEGAEHGGASEASSDDAASSDNAASGEHPALSFTYVNLGDENAEYKYPVFSGGSNDAAVSQLNARLEQEARSAHGKQEYTSPDGVAYYYATWTATVTYLKDDVVGLSYGGYIETGGPHGYPQCWAEVVDLSDGSTMDACEFVGLSVEERDQQTKKLVDDFYSTTGEHDNFSSSDEVFEYYTPDELFGQKSLAYILTTNGVYTYFGPYVLGSYAFGTRTLLMCNLDGAYLGYVDSDPTASYPRESEAASDADPTGANGAESGSGNAGARLGSEADAGSATQQAPSGERSEYHIVTDDFEFDIPEYWRGKVDYFVTTNDEGMSSAIVYPVTLLTQSPESVGNYHLAKIEAVSSDSPTARNMGDIISHVAIKVEAGDKTIVVHSTNWPAERATFFNSNPMYGGSSQEIELMSALVDLISGGSVTYEEAREAGENASSPGEASMLYPHLDVDYLNENLAPTLRAI